MFNSKAYTLLTPPAIEPVSLAEVKSFLKIDGTDEDAVLNILIPSCRRMAEEYTKRAFLTQTWLLTMDSFASDEPLPRDVYPYLPPYLGGGMDAIRLSRQPIQSVTSIVTTDEANATATLSNTVYTLDTSTGTIMRNANYSWPTSLRAEKAVAITFDAGWESPTDVPAPIKGAILQHVAASYANKVCGDLPAGAKALLDPFRLPEAFGAL